MVARPDHKQLTATAIPLFAVAGVMATIVARKRFAIRLDSLVRDLEAGQSACEARTDLPPRIVALAARLGSRRDQPSRIVELRQTGTMWFKPEGRPLAFTARQTIGTLVSGFVWRADIGPFGAMNVVDSFVAGRGYLEARLFGALRVAKTDGTAAINEGEALRYLAELPLNPDAILFNHALDWSVDPTGAIKVAIGQGASRAEVAFHLDEAGLISTVQAASRTFDASGRRYPWHGRFWDYQERSGRLVPMQAEVAWVIEGKDFIYWRGAMTQWIAKATPPFRA